MLLSHKYQYFHTRQSPPFTPPDQYAVPAATSTRTRTNAPAGSRTVTRTRTLTRTITQTSTATLTGTTVIQMTSDPNANPNCHPAPTKPYCEPGENPSFSGRGRIRMRRPSGAGEAGDRGDKSERFRSRFTSRMPVNAQRGTDRCLPRGRNDQAQYSAYGSPIRSSPSPGNLLREAGSRCEG